MPEELPTFDDKKVYTLSGKTLNKIMAAIKSRTIIKVDGYQMKKTAEGIELTRNPT